MHPPSHTDRQAFRRWLNFERVLLTSIHASANAVVRAGDGTAKADTAIALALADLAQATKNHVDAFTDIWAHQCAAFDAIDIRLRELESQRPTQPAGEASASPAPVTT